MNAWEKNLQLLYKKNVSLANDISSHKANDTESIVSRSNLLSGKYRGILINSSYDPLKESKERIKSIEKIDKCTLIVCMGFGLGYEVNEIIKKLNERSLLVVIIINLDIFKMAMEKIDLSAVLSSERIILIDGTSINFEREISALAYNLIYSTGVIGFYIHPVLSRLEKELIEKNLDIIKDKLYYSIFSFGNSVADSFEGLERTLQNYNHILNSPDMHNLKGYFKGAPAICVASGPSIEKNISYLKTIDNKAIVFAAQTILSRLRKEKINFDFAGVIERTKEVYDIDFKGKPLEKEAILLTNSVVFHEILDEHMGKNVVIFRNKTYVENSYSEALEELNSLDTGLSCATLNIAVAAYLGFSPIILVGQDLAYGDGGEDHAYGTVYHDPEKVEKYFSKKQAISEDEIILKGIDGNPVKSTKIWKVFKEDIERIIVKYDAFCIDATEGGAYIEGTKVMRLEDAIKTYCVREVNLDINEVFKLPTSEVVLKRGKLMKEEVRSQLLDTYSVMAICDNVIDLLNRSFKEDYIENNKADIKNFVNMISDSVQDFMKYKMQAFMLQSLIFNLVRENKTFVDINDKETKKRMYNVNYEFFSSVKELMNMLIKIYKNNTKDWIGVNE